MKKLGILISCVSCILLAGCKGEVADKVQTVTKAANPVTLNVTTTWAGTDGGTDTYQKYIQEYMDQTGNYINDSSGGSDETFKQRVIMEFEVGGEPDVLFYFSGTDANTFINAGKVVPLSVIQEEYPEYGENMNPEMFVPSVADGQIYTLPAYGYWEGMFVNKKICEAAKVDVPDKDTTWTEFIQICQKIKDAGYVPIAVPLSTEPHYWFEFAIYNQLSYETHNIIPTSLEDEIGQAWMRGLEEFKQLYQAGYLARNTLYSQADEMFQSFLDGKAAFMIDGSWKVGTVISEAPNVEDFTVTYVPGNGQRKSTDMIGGFSSGWYITQKAWEDPDKRKAAVEFVCFMTSDRVISDFASIALSPTALKNGAMYDESEFCQLQKDAVAMLANSTSIVSAIQDSLTIKCRAPLLEGLKDIVTEKVPIEVAMQNFLDIRQQE